MNPQKNSERVVVTTVVALAPETAFRVFTRDIDRWWRRTPRYRSLPGQSGALVFEGDPPERLVERFGDTTTVIGRVLAWEVGRRVRFEWSGGQIVQSDRTEVEVRFEPHGASTRVTLEHFGLGALPLAHPARGGFEGEAFEAMFGYFWADLLTAYRLCQLVPPGAG
jgi:uncharacterized protein YndB with AHSA1/START domain